MVLKTHQVPAHLKFPPTEDSQATRLLRGGEVASALRREIRTATAHLLSCGGQLPRLVTVNASDSLAAAAYRRSIVKTLDRVGLGHTAVDLPAGSTNLDLQRLLEELCDDQSITGVLVLMPLPPHLSGEVVNEFLSPMKDVDGITPANAGRLHLGLPCLAPSTPQGGVMLLDHYAIPIEGAHTVVVGRSNVVGRPLAALFLGRSSTVTICHRRTKNLEEFTRQADIVAVATGNPLWLNRSHVKPGAAVLDFGINVVDGKIVGDADLAGLLGHAGAITPVPGGTGPVTALVLARNTVAAGFAQLGGTMESLASAFDEFSCPTH